MSRIRNEPLLLVKRSGYRLYTPERKKPRKEECNEQTDAVNNSSKRINLIQRGHFALSVHNAEKIRFAAAADEIRHSIVQTLVPFERENFRRHFGYLAVGKAKRKVADYFFYRTVCSS